MAFDDVPIYHDLLRRRIIITNIANSPRAAGTKWAAFGRVYSAGQVSFQHNFTLGHLLKIF